MKSEYLFSDITEKIIKCFYIVFDELGAGFLESVYMKALIIELENIGLNIDSEKEIKVNYKGTIIGNFRTDIVVEDKVIIEIKAISALNSQHEAQLLNYLKATGIRVGLLVNFGNKLEFKRRIF
ncbi:MAG: GxxExxY protein [Candidatus Cloacimonetes bacterium]|nr:GxxExxY protein [Candidatus Cloacimonadota bacterium]